MIYLIYTNNIDEDGNEIYYYMTNFKEVQRICDKYNWKWEQLYKFNEKGYDDNNNYFIKLIYNGSNFKQST